MKSLLAIVLLLKIASISCFVKDIRENVESGVEIFNDASDIVVAALKTFDLIGDNVETPHIGPTDMEMQVFEAIDNVNMRLDEISEKLSLDDMTSKSIWRRLDSLSKEIVLYLDLHRMMIYQANIDNYYMDFQLYTMNWQRYEHETLLDFVNKIVQHDQGSVSYSMKGLHSALFGESTLLKRENNVVQILFNEASRPGSDLFCVGKQSPQEILNNFFYGIVFTELKTVTLLMFAYSVKRLYGQGNFTGEMEKAVGEHYVRMGKIEDTMYHMTSNLSTALWNCDSGGIQVPSETYEEFTNFLQGYILNEINLDKKEKCYGTCSAEEFRYRKIQNCEDDWCKKQTQCKQVIECGFVDSELAVCENHKENSTRRYESIQFGNGMKYGKEVAHCNRKMLENYSQYVFFKCDYCVCLCESKRDRHSDRFINLRASLADVKNNRVVTGLRFVKRNRIIHLQVQQGRLLAGAKIDPSTIEWVPIEDYKITNSRLQQGQDYVTLTYLRRAFDLDDVQVPSDRVVTGLRFRTIGQHINLEILATPFNYHTGTLDLSNPSSYIGNSQTIERSEVQLHKPDIPTRNYDNSIMSKNNTYVKFQNTDFVADAAQSTVPFFDIRPVMSLQPTPLGGVGVFHRGTARSGGFIAPKIFSYDISVHLKPNP